MNSLQFITIIPMRINEYTTHKSTWSKAYSPQPPAEVSTRQPGERAFGHEAGFEEMKSMMEV